MNRFRIADFGFGIREKASRLAAVLLVDAKMTTKRMAMIPRTGQAPSVDSDLASYRPSRIEHRGEVFILNRELACTVAREDGLVVIAYGPLHLMAYAESREEAIRNLAEEFSFLWAEYAGRPDSELTEDARELKVLLQSLVKEKKP